MLDLDLDLEADLGIDTVKQAEMFAAIRAAYDIPREDNLKLRDFPTLAHTIQFVYDRKPELKKGGGGIAGPRRNLRRSPAERCGAGADCRQPGGCQRDSAAGSRAATAAVAGSLQTHRCAS